MRATSVRSILATLLTSAVILGTIGCANTTPTTESSAVSSTQTSGEVEATEFQGVKLTPISDQRNNALKGTQVIDRESYRLVVDGLVERQLSLSYADLQAYEQESWLMDLNCVEGWSFTAKWTGPSLPAILNDAGVKPEALIVIEPHRLQWRLICLSPSSSTRVCSR